MSDEFMMKAESEIDPEMKAVMQQEAALKTLAMIFNQEFTLNETLRRDKEIEWAQDLRQIKGIYDPEVKIPNNRSKVYPKYTRSKVVPCIAKLNNMLYPNSEKNWSIGPTPEPEITQEQMQELMMSLIQQHGSDASPDKFVKALNDYVRQRSERMSIIMDDQMTEGRHTIVGKKVLASGVHFGTGVLKGPSTRTVARRKTEGTGNAIQYVTSEEKRPVSEFVSLWRYYPDMMAVDPDDKDHDFELHCLTKHQLRKLAKRSDFNGEKIREFITKNPNGNYKQRQWELDVQLAGENTSAQRSNAVRYEVHERWGYVDGQMLADSGIEGFKSEHAERDVYCNHWILGDDIIKAALEPTPIDATTGDAHKMHHLFYWDKDESSIFGSGLPRSIRDTQIAICAAVRMAINNAADASGAILEIFEELYPGDADVTDIYPMRVYKREGHTGADMQYPGIRSINIESHIQDYLALIAMLKQMGDDESTLPAFLYSQATGNETAEGISIRTSNQNVTIGDIVANFDTCNESYLKALYAWNMEFNEDESIKGDFMVKAIGTKTLLTKELRSRSIDNFKTTLTPEDSPYIKRMNLLAESAKARDLDPAEFLNTEEEAQQIIEGQMDREAAALAKAKMASEIEYDKAKAANMFAKAQQTPHKTKLEAVKTLHELNQDEGDDDGKTGTKK